MSDEQHEGTTQEAATWGPYGAAKPETEDPVLKPGPDGGVAIIGALIDAMAAIEAVGKENLHEGKDGEKFTGRWKYRSADDVVTAVQPALVKGGVLCVPNLVNIERERGALQMTMEYRFFARDGSSITVRIVSNGAGNTAYTIGAAYSYALKYVLSQLLMIPFDDERMDMESDGSMGSGELGSGSAPRGQQRQAAPGAPWWEAAGWESLDQLAAQRQEIVDRMRALPPVHLEAMKLRLDALDEVTLFRTDNGRRYKGRVWQPKNKAQPKGPGSIAMGPTVEAAGLVLEILRAVEDEALREAAGEEPFEVDSPRGEDQGTLDEAAEAAGEEPYAEPGTPLGEGDGADGLEPTPGEKLTAARKATQERSKRRRSAASKSRAGQADRVPEPASVAPEASQMVLEGRKWLSEAFLEAKPEAAEQLRETLEDAEYWPIGEITEEQMADALTLAAAVLAMEGEGEA